MLLNFVPAQQPVHRHIDCAGKMCLEHELIHFDENMLRCIAGFCWAEAATEKMSVRYESVR